MYFFKSINSSGSMSGLRLTWLITVFWVFFFNVAVASSVDDVKSIDNLDRLLIEVDWLKNNIKRSQVVVVDARKESEYLQGHIDGAVNIPVESTYGNAPNNDLVGPISQVQSIIENAGIDNDTKVILYDDGKYTDAARIFWVLEVYGHKHASILNGGFPAWKDHALPVSTNKTSLPKKTFLPSIVPDILSTKLSTRLAINDKSKLIVDARSSQEYSGKKSRTDRFGHIPSSVNIPFYLNYDTYSGITKLKPVEELKKVYENIGHDKKIIAYCNRGKESALTYFVLRRLGYNVSAYDGSWLEWSADDSLPVIAPSIIPAK